jgi:hypothetical protein
VQFQLASDKKIFLRHEWLGLLFVIFPFLRPVRAVRGLIFGGGNLGPVTVEGRLIATFLLMFGLGLLASMTGYVASWVLHEFNVARDNEPQASK